MRHLSLSLLMTSYSYLCLTLAYLQNLAPTNVCLFQADIATNKKCGVQRRGAARKGTAHLADEILS